MRLQANAFNDNNGLETDIMRFFAIITLCLMVVFSLVQSLPFKGEDNLRDDKTPELISKKILEHKIELLNQQINNLLTKNKLLNSEIVVYESKENLTYILKQIKENIKVSQQQLKKSKQQVNESQKQIEQVQKKNYKLAKQLLETNLKLEKANKLYQEAIKKTEQAQELVNRFQVKSPSLTKPKVRVGLKLKK